jgi:D-lactate dehydrogenase (cytochrome)
MDVVVQPCVPWMSLNDQIKDSGLFFPVDPGPSVRFPIWHTGPTLISTIGQNRRHGGNELQVRPQVVAERRKLTIFSGTNAVRYGTMKEWVINLTVVLADGTVIKTRKRPR